MEPTEKTQQIEPVLPCQPLEVVSSVVENGHFFLLYSDSQKRKKQSKMKVYKKGKFSEFLKIIGIASVIEIESEGEMYVLHKDSLEKFIDDHKASDDEQLQSFALCLEKRKHAIEDAEKKLKPRGFKETILRFFKRKPCANCNKKTLKKQ